MQADLGFALLGLGCNPVYDQDPVSVCREPKESRYTA